MSPKQQTQPSCVREGTRAAAVVMAVSADLCALPGHLFHMAWQEGGGERCLGSGGRDREPPIGGRASSQVRPWPAAPHCPALGLSSFPSVRCDPPLARDPTHPPHLSFKKEKEMKIVLLVNTWPDGYIVQPDHRWLALLLPEVTLCPMGTSGTRVHPRLL